MSFSETAVYFKERFNLPDSIEEIKQAWVEMSLEKYQKEVPVKPGVREFLEEISIRGIKAGIATSNGREMVDAVLKSLGLEQYFQVVATACEVAAGNRHRIFTWRWQEGWRKPETVWYLRMFRPVSWQEKCGNEGHCSRR